MLAVMLYGGSSFGNGGYDGRIGFAHADHIQRDKPNCLVMGWQRLCSIFPPSTHVLWVPDSGHNSGSSAVLVRVAGVSS